MNLDGLIAFGSGLLSFFAPCVLPLVPSYLIFISGASMDPQGESASARFNKMVLAHALVFVLGFSFVFVLLGASSSILGRFLSAYQLYITKLGGILLIVMGLFSLDIIKIPLLNQEKVIHLKEKPLGFFGSFMVGVTFSLGWTPCIGPALSSILILASTEESVGRGSVSLEHVFSGAWPPIHHIGTSFPSAFRPSQTLRLCRQVYLESYGRTPDSPRAPAGNFIFQQSSPMGGATFLGKNRPFGLGGAYRQTDFFGEQTKKGGNSSFPPLTLRDLHHGEPMKLRA